MSMVVRYDPLVTDSGGDLVERATGTRAQRLLWPLLAVAVAYLYFFGGTYFGVYDASVRLASLAILGAIFAVWVIAALRDPRWRPQAHLTPALGVALGTMVLSAVASSNPRISLDYVAFGAILAALYLLLRQLLADDFYRPRLTALAMLLGMVLLVAYVAAVMARWITWWGWVGHLAVPPLRPFYEGLSYGNPGAVAALAALGVILTAAHLGFSSRKRVAAIVVQAVVASVVIFITASRASWVAVAGAATVFGAVGMALPANRRMLRRRFAQRRAHIALGAVAAVAIAIGLALGPKVIDRFINGGTEAERTSFLVVSARLFAQAPAVGAGPGMWVANRINATTASETDYYIPHAHNLPAQIAAEYGVVGVVAAIAVLWLVARLLVRALRGDSSERRRWAWVAVVSLVYLGIHQLFDLFANMPTVLFIVALPVAFIDATDRSSEPTRVGPRGQKVALGAALCILLVAVGWWAWSDRTALAQATANDAIESGDWASATKELQAARDSDPSMPAIWLPLGLAEARTDQAAALDTLRQLGATDGLPTAWLDVAALEVQRDEVQAARDDLERALRVGRQQPQVAFAAGWLYERLGDLTAADQLYAEALVLDPRLSRDPFWQEAARANRWSAIRDRAIAGLDLPGQVNFWLSADDVSRARTALAQIPTAEQGALPLVVEAWQHGPAERTALERYTSSHPLDLVAITYAARVAARAGDYDRAQMYRDWADTVWGNAGAQGAELKVGEPKKPGAPATGINSITWGLYTYRRATPADQLVPGLPHLVLTQ